MVGGPGGPVGGAAGPMVWRAGRNLGQRLALPAGRMARIKRGVFAGSTQFAAPGSRHLASSFLRRAAARLPPLRGQPQHTAFPSGGRNNGVQLRGHYGEGGQVSRPPRQQHDADGGVGVAKDDAEELFVSVGRRRPRRRAQVRLRAGHARRFVQVPAPPQQLPRPQPRATPRFPSFPRHGRPAAAGRAVLVLPHGRGAVT